MHGICLASSEAWLLWLSSPTGNDMSVLLVTGLGSVIKHCGFITFSNLKWPILYRHCAPV